MAATPFQKLVRDFEPYLEDARKRMVFVTVFFVCLFVAGFLFAPTLIAYLLSHVQIPSVQYIAASPFQVISMSIDVGFAIAVAGSFPLIVAEVYEFVSPALRIRERVLLIRYLTLSVLLFVTGFLYGSVSMYYAIQLVAGFNTGLGLQNLWAIAPFFSQILLTSALLGVLFQFPIILALLVRLGIATGKILRGQRRIVIALVFLLVALLPPTDGLSLIVMSAPLIILYELTVWLVWCWPGAIIGNIRNMFGIGTKEIVIIAIVLVLLFGTRKIPELAQSLVEAIRTLKKAFRDDDASLSKKK